MPPIKAEIKITGLACFRLIKKRPEDITGDLQVLFVHPNEKHSLRMLVKNIKADKIVSYDIERDTHLKLTATGAVSGPPASPKPSIEEMVNIDKLHAEIPVPPNPPHLFFKKLDISTSIGLSYLSIPQVQCYTAEMSPEEKKKQFEFWKIVGDTKTRKVFPAAPGIPETRTKRIGTHIGIEFTINDNGNLTLTFADRAGTVVNGTKVFRNEPSADAGYEITFDNHCHDLESCSGDFQHYYSILTDDPSGGESTVQFEIIVPFAPIKPPSTTHDAEAACNPTMSDTEGCDLRNYFVNGGQCP